MMNIERVQALGIYEQKKDEYKKITFCLASHLATFRQKTDTMLYGDIMKIDLEGALTLLNEAVKLQKEGKECLTKMNELDSRFGFTSRV